MSRIYPVWGETVRELRSRRAEGASIGELVELLSDMGLDETQVDEHLEQAFLLSLSDTVMIRALCGAGRASDDVEVTSRVPRLTSAREQWEHGPAFPELMLRWHRNVFRRLARDHRLVIVVCGASRAAGRYIGQQGFEPVIARRLGVPRVAEPHAGLLAADPADERFARFLASFDPPRSYSDHLAALVASGLTVGAASEGCVVRRADGTLLYEGYYLHGVYDSETGANAWTARAAPRLRRELALALGAELVRGGPHDLWEARNDRKAAGPVYGPQLPVIILYPDGNVSHLIDVERMRSYYRAARIDWDAIYPPASEPAPPGVTT